MKLDPNPVALDFFQSLYARQAVWSRRAASHPYPWTNNPVLQKYDFTNVFRELDEGTKLLVHYLNLAAEVEMSPGEIIFNVWFYRQLDNPEAWASITEDCFLDFYQAVDLPARLEARKAQRLPIMTRKHTVCSFPNLLRGIETMLRLSGAVAVKLKDCTDLQDVSDIFTSIPPTTDFSGYQIAQDLTYGVSPLYPTSVDRWAYVSAEVRKSLNMLYEFDIKPTQALSALQAARTAQDECFKALGLDFKAVAAPGYERLTLSSMAHWMNEYPDYVALRDGGKTTKAEYVPKEENV